MAWVTFAQKHTGSSDLFCSTFPVRLIYQVCIDCKDSVFGEHSHGEITGVTVYGITVGYKPLQSTTCSIERITCISTVVLQQFVEHIK